MDIDSDETFEAFLNEGIILRSLKSYNMDRFVRVSIGQEFENDAFIEAAKRLKVQGIERTNTNIRLRSYWRINSKSLCKQGIKVYAEDLSKKTITYAIKNKIIKGTFSNLDLSKPYSVIFSTPPIVTNKLVNENKDLIKNAVLFTETSSSKNKIKKNAFINKIENAILSHPIAGNEGSGIDASDIKLLKTKFVFFPVENDVKNSITKAQKLWGSLGSNCIKMDLNSHDKILAAQATYLM